MNATVLALLSFLRCTPRGLRGFADVPASEFVLRFGLSREDADALSFAILDEVTR